MDAALRQLVRDRAGDRCEYCRIQQDADWFFRFHIEHIVALQHGGETVASNLAWSCHHCNLHKGPNLSGIDPQSDTVVRLFHPRTDRWEDHFMLEGGLVRGISATGRATVRVLAMNSLRRVVLRTA